MEEGNRLVKVKDFFEQPSLYLHKRFGVELRRSIIRELLSDREIGDLLDVGCGDGSLSLDYVPRAHSVCLTDLSENMLRLARANMEKCFPGLSSGSIRFIQGDIGSIDLDKTFDLVLLIGVLAHVTDIDKTFERLYNVINPGGALVIQFTDASAIMAKINKLARKKKTAYALNALKVEQLNAVVRRHSFAVTETRKYLIPFPGMGSFSDRQLFLFQRWALSKRWLSWLMTDYLMVLEKNNR